MSKYLRWSSYTLNFIALVVLLYFYFGGITSYVRDNLIAPNYERWVSQYELLTVDSESVVFLGDSITRGGLWQEWFPGIRAINRGIEGDLSFATLARLKPIVDGKPGKIFLMIGTNDIHMGRGELEIAADVVRILDAIQAASPDTKVYVQSVLPRSSEYRRRVESLNSALHDVVKGKAVWVDLYSAFLDESDGSIIDIYSNDEIHLTGKGYLVWSRVLAPYVGE